MMRSLVKTICIAFATIATLGCLNASKASEYSHGFVYDCMLATNTFMQASLVSEAPEMKFSIDSADTHLRAEWMKRISDEGSKADALAEIGNSEFSSLMLASLNDFDCVSASAEQLKQCEDLILFLEDVKVEMK